MYNEHFGLRQAPFRITPDTRLFYDGGGRGEILDALVYAIVSGEGIVKVIGEVGTGKTMLCRMLEERLPEHVEIVYLANPSLKPDDILQAIALEMNLDVLPNSNRLTVMHAMQQRLLEKHAGNRQVVVFVEEAQSMPIETLEEIRLLSNLETKREKLLQIVLFGQPELDENLDQPSIRQLKERITHSFYLEPLKRNELRDYVNFRMRAVGYRGPDVFRANAYFGMARASEGLTRRINILADKALLAAFAADRHDVTLKDVRKAVNDTQFEPRQRRRAPVLGLWVGALVAAGVAAWFFLDPLGVAGPPADPPALSPPTSSAQPLAKATPAFPAEESAAAPTQDEALVTPNPPVARAREPDPATETTTSNAHVAEEVASTPPLGEPALAVATTEAEPASPAALAAAARAVELSPTGIPRATQESLASFGEAMKTSITPPPTASAESSEPPAEAPATAQASNGFDDLIVARLTATRQWLKQANNAHYSIQLLLTPPSQRQSLEAFLQRQTLNGRIEHVYVYETVIDDKPYLGVLYREFSSYSAAKRALENLPRDLKRLGPFIRNVSDVTTIG